MLKKWFSCRDVACNVSTVCHISLYRFVVDVETMHASSLRFVIVWFVWFVWFSGRDVACNVSTAPPTRIFIDPDLNCKCTKLIRVGNQFIKLFSSFIFLMNKTEIQYLHSILWVIIQCYNGKMECGIIPPRCGCAPMSHTIHRFQPMANQPR